MKMTLQEIAQRWRIYVVERITTASHLLPRWLVVYEPVAGGENMGFEREPIAVALAAFPTEGSAMGHVKRIASVLASRTSEWHNIGRLESHWKKPREWKAMVIAISDEIVARRVQHRSNTE